MMLFAYDDNKVANLTMTNENTTFPKENMLTVFRKQVAKATAASTTITFTAASVMDIYILNCNATTGHVTVTEAGVTILDEDFYLLVANSLNAMGADHAWQKENFHIELPKACLNATVTITLNGNENIHIGRLHAEYTYQRETTLADGYSYKPADYTKRPEVPASVTFKANMTPSEAKELEQYLAKDSEGTHLFVPYKEGEKDYYIGYGEVTISSYSPRTKTVNITIKENR